MEESAEFLGMSGDMRGVKYAQLADWIGLTGLIGAFGAWLLGLAIAQFSTAADICPEGTDEYTRYTSCGAEVVTGLLYLCGFLVASVGAAFQLTGKNSPGLASVTLAFSCYILAESVRNFSFAAQEFVCKGGTYPADPRPELDANTGLCAVAVIDALLMLCGWVVTTYGARLSYRAYAMGKDTSLPIGIACVAVGFGTFLIGTLGDMDPERWYYIGANKGAFVSRCVCAAEEDTKGTLCEFLARANALQCGALVSRTCAWWIGGAFAVFAGAVGMVRNVRK